MSAVLRELRRNRLKGQYGQAVATFILIAIGLMIILPMLLPWLFVFKTQLEYNYNPWGLPDAFNFLNFKEAWQAIRIGEGLVNTLIVCLGAVFLSLPCSALAGYACARYKNRWTELAFYAIMMGYFVPIQMVLIPLYKICQGLHISNTLHGLFLPMVAFNVPFWTMIYRSFFKGLPGDLFDAARIDGAGHTATFLKIMLPLAMPATMLALILVFIGAWSDYLLSLVLVNDAKLFTMQLRVAQFMSAYGTGRMPRYAAAALIAAAPTILLYIAGHKWILKGTLAGALKE